MDIQKTENQKYKGRKLRPVLVSGSLSRKKTMNKNKNSLSAYSQMTVVPAGSFFVVRLAAHVSNG